LIFVFSTKHKKKNFSLTTFIQGRQTKANRFLFFFLLFNTNISAK